MNSDEKEVYDRLYQSSKKKLRFDEQAKLTRLQIRVPEVRKLMKPKYSFITNETEKNNKAWSKIWKETQIFEIKSQALYFYQYRSLSKKEFQTIIKWAPTLSTWEHSDDFSKILAQVTEENPHWTIPIFRKWNQSKNLWLRRQSLIGLIEYASKRKNVLPFKTYISFIHPLLADDAYYVQKAFGWTLREVYNIYPKECFHYLSKNIHQFSSIAFSTSTEKCTIDEKSKLKKLRN
jgi:3-methyladenine DNA glycosylase AlkD